MGEDLCEKLTPSFLTVQDMFLHRYFITVAVFTIIGYTQTSQASQVLLTGVAEEITDSQKQNARM